jgi:hypothetical protein
MALIPKHGAAKRHRALTGHHATHKECELA